MRRATCALAAAAAALVAAPATGSAPHPAAAKSRVTIDDFAHGAAGWARSGGSRASVRTVDGEPVLTIAGSLARSLGAGATVSFDLKLSRGAVADVHLGAAGTLHLHARHGWLVAARATRVHRSAAPSGWYRVEAATSRPGATLDGQRVRTSGRAAPRRIVIAVPRGTLSLRSFVASAAGDRSGLLLQRLAWLHTRTPRGKQPIGTGLDSRLRFSRSWTRGFWPGSLWHAYDMTGSAMFKRWAIRATRDNFGAEHADSHDLGFMYGGSSAVAYDHICAGSATSADCKAFRRSAMTAADSLLALAATNAVLGTIPTRSSTPCTGCTSTDESDTIVDSLMNLQLLFWAARVSGDRRYSDVASRHAHVVAETMVRTDGSTWSSMHNRRSDGAFIRFHTHQGYRDDSTWARGQAWAVYGLSAAAAALHDSELLATAQRATRYVTAKMPVPTVPPYDYDAPPSAPRDVSAGVIAAAGMLRLADACEELAASCDPSPADARAYAERLLSASLANLGTASPLGFLGHQVYGLGGTSSWDDDAELTFGIDYALEALGASQ